MFAASKTASVSGGYQISRSLRFNSADSAYLNRTPASAGNQKTWTWSGWVKRSSLDSFNILFATSNGQIYFDNQKIDVTLGASGTGIYITNAVYRDVSAWYHIVVACDTTQATAANRLKLYVNGSQVTSFGTQTDVTQNANTSFNSVTEHDLGRFPSNYYLNGYMTEIYFVDGQQLDVTSFGETNAQTGVWQPKAYSGSYGTNGFYLNFSDNSNTTAATLGKDYSGNGNNWTPNNFSVTAGAGNDSLVDTPTAYGTDTGVGGEVRGNYCTLNPLNNAATLANGNLDLTFSTAGWYGSSPTMFVTSGKWYWEVTVTALTNYVYVGIISPNILQVAGVYPGSSTTSYGYASADGKKYNNSSGAIYGSTYGLNDVIGVALDMDAGTLAFYKNNTSQGTAYTGLSGTFGPATSVYQASVATNFGQRPFAYTAPSGYKALCTQNLPTPTIGATTATQANKYFAIVLRNGASPAGATFSTTVNMANGALLWDKTRNLGGDNLLTDSVRGISKYLVSNTTGAEGTDVNYVTAFGTNSYTVGSTDWPSDRTIVDWMWAANGSGSSNTAGSITSTVSANTTSGFSIVTYTGTGANATVGHGLGVAPKMVIVRARSMPANWMVWQTSITGSQYLVLESTAAAGTESTVWNSTVPSSTVISIGTNGASNFSGTTYVAYCFAEVAGYSKFGSYTGNASADGPFVYTGFRPAYVMVKCSSTTGLSWVVNDATRNPSNAADLSLFPNISNAEVSGSFPIDFCANGFKVRATSGINDSGQTFIFAAFATAPLKYALAR